MNDGAALFLSTVLIRLCDKYELPLKPYMIAMATSANIGSAASVLGNPKNMVIHAKADLDFMAFMTRLVGCLFYSTEHEAQAYLCVCVCVLL